MDVKGQVPLWRKERGASMDVKGKVPPWRKDVGASGCEVEASVL